MRTLCEQHFPDLLQSRMVELKKSLLENSSGEKGPNESDLLAGLHLGGKHGDDDDSSEEEGEEEEEEED